MADSLTNMVQSIVANLPEGANPWQAIAVAFTGQVRPDLGPSFLDQLYACSALIALTTIVLAACMWSKYRQGNYWLFRTHRGTGGTYLVPHYSSTFTTLMVIFYGVLQGYLWKTVYFCRGDLVKDSALWRLLVWLAGWLSFYCAAWSLCVSHVLHLDSAGRPARSFLAQAPFMNTFFTLVPIGFIVSIACLAAAANQKYRSAMNNYSTINAALIALQATYNGTFDESLFQSGSGFSVADGFTTDLSSFGQYFRVPFIVYLIWCILLEFFIVVAGVLHLRELRHAMDELANRSSFNDEARAQEKMLETTYNSLVYITYGLTVVLTAFNVLFAYVAAAGRKVIYVKVYSEIASLLPLWIFAALGFPLSVLFLRQIRLANPSKPRSPSHSNDKVGSTTTPLPMHETFSSPSAILEGSKPPPSDDTYPMSHLSPVAGSPQSQRAAGPGTPASMDMDDSSTYKEPGSTGSRASDAHLVPVMEQPFYSSYATRKPIEEPEEGGSPGWGSKVRGWRG
ncbi:hypothetical protein JCM1840_000129 [Sporobolomyces johnsonii]